MRRLLASALLLTSLLGPSAFARPTMLVYIGTFTPSAPHHGIYSAKFDLETGALSDARPVAELADPSFLALSSEGRTLFATGLVANTDGSIQGLVSSFRIDRSTGSLKPLSRQPNGTEAACHVSLSPDGRTLFTANYGNGFAASFPVSSDGEVGPALSRIKHEGSSINRNRQEAPHVHGMTPSPDGRFVFAPDLGTDRVVAYKVTTKGALEPHPEGTLITPAGQGPRHVTFSRDGRFLYEIDELVAAVRVHAYDATSGKAKFIQQISTLPADFKGGHSGAEIQIHPNGRWLYASNREEHQSVAVFAIDAASGRLTLVQLWQPGLVHPRFITPDPSGRWFVCTNTFGDSIVTAPLDPETGRIGSIVSKISIPRPSCVVFVP